MSIGLGNDIVVGRRIGVRLSGGGASLDADAATLIAAMTTTPDSTRQGHINTLITGLKADGVWAKLDELWVMAAHAEQAALLGWKRAKDLTAVNAPTFEVDRGFTGNGTTSYLNTNYVPSTDGVQYTLNDASFGVYSRTDGMSDPNDMGVVSTHRALLNIRRLNGQGISEINSLGITNRVLFANSVSTGLIVSRRTASNAIQFLINGSSAATNSEVSTGLPGHAFFVGTFNNAGTPGSFSTRQYAAAFVGAAMSEAQQLALFNRLETYLDAIGAGVVS